MKHLQITQCILALILVGCGGRQAGTDTPADLKATAMKLIDASLEPEAACEQWARLLVEEPGAVPLAAGADVVFHGRLQNESETLVPASIRSAASQLELQFDIDIARTSGDGIRCAGMFRTSATQPADGQSPFDRWQAGEMVDAEDLADGQWSAAYILDLDLAAQGEGLAAARAFVALMFEGYRSAGFTSYYAAFLDEPELEQDVNADGRTETVFLASEHEVLTSPGEEEQGDRFEEITDARALVIHDDEMRFIVWETHDSRTRSSYDDYEPQPSGTYELLDLGIGRTVFAFIVPIEPVHRPCTLDGQEEMADIEIHDMPTYKLLDGHEWEAIFAWKPAFESGQPCPSYPWEVSIDPVRSDEGPWEVHATYEWQDDQSPDTTDVWTFDGKKYVLTDTRTEN